MSVRAFVPEIWSARILVALRKSLVYGAPDIASTEYEGDINEAGDTVNINSISRPTVKDYVPNSTVIVREKLTAAQRKLVIDQSKYWAFDVDDVDKRQAMGNLLGAGVDEAAYAMADVADQFIASKYTDVQAANNLGTVAVTTADIAYTQIRKLALALNKANVSRQGRWLVLPAFMASLLLENNKFIDASASGSTEPLQNGVIGRALGFTIRESNNAPNPTGDDYVVMAGVKGAIAYADQINKTEAYRPEDSFSDAVKGLHLYGAKVVRPDSIAVLTASET